MDDRFVNPYNFVPLPETVKRSEPWGHVGGPTDDSGSPFCSGTITVEWTLTSPLQIPTAGATEGWIEGDRKVRLPGSSIKGAVRSLHETMFRGCLRVLDSDFVPGYRMPAEAPSGAEATKWTLAIITRSNNGRPLRGLLCDDLLWIDASELKRHYPHGELPNTGDVIDVTGSRDVSSLGRTESRTVNRVHIITSGSSLSSALRTPHDDSPEEMVPHGRVFLVTSTSVRRKERKDGSKGRAFWVSGQVTQTPVAFDESPDSSVIKRFRASCEGTDDRRRLLGGDDTAWTEGAQFDGVNWWVPGRSKQVPVARRALQSGKLFPGDVVWVRTEDDRGTVRATDIRLAQIWREPGSTSVAERISQEPDSPLPCQPTENELHLCLSCSVFGGADTAGGESGKGTNAGYAGHVRFSSALSATSLPSALPPVVRTPMGAPKPGTGMFYLRRPEPGPRRDEHDMPGHWGSQEDDGWGIRGRKYYWHGNPDEQAERLSRELGTQVQPRYQASQKQLAGNMTEQVHLVPVGTVFEATVTVDRLPVWAIHTVLAALDPGRALRLIPDRDDSTFAVHLGGGKPLGLGSAVPRITAINVAPVHARYGQSQDGTLEWGTRWPGEVQKSVFHRCGEVGKTWESLASMLDLDELGDDTVRLSYPPGAPWRDIDKDGFRESFRFFGAASGERLADSDKPWSPLPLATSSDKTQPIQPKNRR